MVPDDEVLAVAARDGSLDVSIWPALLESILNRLDYIVYNDFPTPSIPPPIRSSGGDELPTASGYSQASKENIAPNTVSAGGTASGTSCSPTSQSIVPNSQSSFVSAPLGTLPPQLLSLLSSIRTTLERSFSEAPPYTIQRLAELLLHPNDHYRTLPSYLRAIDRVVSVSSAATEFPLPSLAVDPAESGEATSYLAVGAPSLNLPDEVNGAALTRIPWLRETGVTPANPDRQLMGDLRTESTSLIDGPHGAGAMETVTVIVNGVTKPFRDMTGLPNHSDAPSDTARAEHTARDNLDSNAVVLRDDDTSEETVHARGPAEIGMEDMGPQATASGAGHFDIEAALGRPGEGEDMTRRTSSEMKDENYAVTDTTNIPGAVRTQDDLDEKKVDKSPAHTDETRM